MKTVFLAIAVLLYSGVFAQAKDPICRVWYNEEKDSKVEVYATANGTYQAKVVWLKEPVLNGKTRVDEKNPNEKLRNRPIMGLVFLWNLKKSPDEKDFYVDGKIYDPKNGKTYDCRMTFKGDHIDLRGYVLGMPFLGRTSVWTKAD
ncbi:MAG: DUF2147 domain-containing protein [Chitinophagales bacterium]